MRYLRNDITGNIVESNNWQEGYSLATQEQIDVFLLKKARKDKVIELNDKLGAFRKSGFIYQGSLGAPATFNLSEDTARYADVKSSRALGGANKYKFYDQAIPRVKRDFIDSTGFEGFVDAINEEEERLMEKFNGYQEDIEEAENVAAVDAITIDFSP